jgi:4-hydroxy-tetrahydrodipicolinate reductase
MSSPVRVLLVGAAGRMGRAIKRAAEAQSDIIITAECDLGDILDHSIPRCDVVIDFSHPDATEQNCAACVASEKPIVIGTTGHSRAQVAVIEDAAKSIPLLLASNFSVGVNALFWLTQRAAQLLGDTFDIEIVETHHRFKKDAPSGTAKRLAQILCEARSLQYDKDVLHGREGTPGERSNTEIGIHAIRAGDVVGDHTVIFAAPGERLELTHKASSRETFAVGALRAARWIIGKPARLYSMEDVLGLAETTR